MPKITKRTRWILRAGFVIACALTLFFGVRTVLNALYWHDPVHNDQVIEGWMPLGYIGRSWNLPPEVILESVGLDPTAHRRVNLTQLSDETGIPLEVLVDQVTTAIDAYRASHND